MLSPSPPRDVQTRDTPGPKVLVQRARGPPRRLRPAAPIQHPTPSLPPRTPQPDRPRSSNPNHINYADTSRITRVQDSGSRPDPMRSSTACITARTALVSGWAVRSRSVASQKVCAPAALTVGWRFACRTSGPGMRHARIRERRDPSVRVHLRAPDGVCGRGPAACLRGTRPSPGHLRTLRLEGPSSWARRTSLPPTALAGLRVSRARTRGRRRAAIAG
jgi:hypothetical protein